MQYRKLGNSGLSVSPLCLGGNVFGWTVDEQSSYKILDAFLDAGFNFIDTADVYSRWVPGNEGGESESIIGNWMNLRSCRDKVIIATKIGSDMGSGQNLSKDYIIKGVEASLKRLKTDHIDLYQSHIDDEKTPLEETLEAYYTLVEQGKVRAIGASNYSALRLLHSVKVSELHGYPRYESLQPLYNLYDREKFEKELEPVCLKENIGVITYYSLASGFLTGKYRNENDFDKSPRGAGVKKKYFNDKGLKILNALDEISTRLNSTPAQVSLAWLMARPSVTAPIASATTIEQLSDLTEAADLVLDRDAITLLDKASA
jgi:aryl-alcohol dehydrogenase-like predicted oxidoreductase